MQYAGLFPEDVLPFWFLLAIGVRWAIGFIGFWLNASLVYVTIRSSSLREFCNLLIAANAAFAGLFGLSLSLGLGLILSGHAFLSESACVQLQALPLLLRNLGLNSLLFIAVDRLICVLFTSWDHNHWLYLAAIGGLSLGHGLFIVINCLEMALLYPDHLTLCSTHDDVYFGPAANTLFTLNIVVSLLVLLAHILLWGAVRLRKKDANHVIMRRLVRSLLAMMSMLVAGFLVNNLVQILYAFITVSDQAKAYLSILMAWLPALAFASNAPLLVAFSTEYRKAYQRVLGPLLEWLTCNKWASQQTNQQSLERRTIRVKSARNAIGP